MRGIVIEKKFTEFLVCANYRQLKNTDGEK